MNLQKRRKSSLRKISSIICVRMKRTGMDWMMRIWIRAYILKMVNMRYAIGSQQFPEVHSTTLASDVSDETVAAIMENQDQLDGSRYCRGFPAPLYGQSSISRRSSVIRERFPRKNMMR